MPAPAAAGVLAAPHAGHGGGSGKGHAKQVTDGRNTANAPTITSAVHQVSTGRRNVNAAAGNNGVAVTGLQQEASVSFFTDTLSGNCKKGVADCEINQKLRPHEAGHPRHGGRGQKAR
ncbi:hypothetical protein AB0O28_13805 [Microbispora sp. NPDC088329]|uniref:hypothetical protein n=1 Tax=Microbispora sp. NPDC088329 TaxID=3154869 RepID=UPI003420F9C6